MDPTKVEASPVLDMPPPVARLLIGLLQQREELGLIADELLDIFRRNGYALPPDARKGEPAD